MGEAAVPCISCSNRDGNWAIGKPPNWYLSCARCFLCISPWGKEHSDQIADLVSMVEEEMGVPISVDGVVVPEHADRILHSIVMTTGVAKVRSDRRRGE